MEDFEENLFQNYRDYLDENGQLREDRRKNFEAFVYMVENFLSSVNAEQNNYRGSTRKVANLSEVFTVSDEAFALLLVDNYWEKWENVLKKDTLEKEKKADKSLFKARYTDSEAGRNEDGYSDEGLQKYNELVKMVSEKRNEQKTGEDLEEYLMAHWIGNTREVQKKKPRPAVIGFVDTDALFGSDSSEKTKVDTLIEAANDMVAL